MSVPEGETAEGNGPLVTVASGGRRTDYPVTVERGLLARLPVLVERYAPAYRYAVIADATVARLYGDEVARALVADGGTATLHTFPAGERHKSRESWVRLTDELLEAGHGRDSAVVAVGGGVTGDLGGFVAATFMRGIPVVQVPTSLVAMIDASVGGKTGVDVPRGKNLVGAFHPPRLVAVDPEVVTTLPRHERAQGLAEAVKHGAILDAAYLEALRRAANALLDGDPEAVEAAVVRSVELKARVVAEDEREGGLRQILNFGHTLGHAVEAAAGYRRPHGSAVSAGMVLEARIGEALGVTEAGTGAHLAEVLTGLELPLGPGALDDPGAILAYTRSDKKARAGAARYVLLEAMGRVARSPGGAWSREVEDGVVRREVTRWLEAPSDPRGGVGQAVRS